MSTQELSVIQQELDNNPNERHRDIAARLGISSRAVTLVCNDSGKKCTHTGKKNAKSKKPVAIKKATAKRIAQPADVVPRRVAINVSNADWTRFTTMYHRDAASHLGNLVRAHLKDLDD